MFSAMGTEARLRIIQLLLSAHPDALVVGEIQQELDIPNSALSHQSWLRPSLTIALDPTLPHTVQGAIHQELCVPLRSRNSRTHMSPPGASAARAGRSLVRKLPDPILFSRFVTTPPKRFAQMWPGAQDGPLGHSGSRLPARNSRAHRENLPGCLFRPRSQDQFVHQPPSHQP